MFAHEARIADHAGCPVIIDGEHGLPPADLSVLSYNVLLPNSKDGWWIYKYFDASVALHHCIASMPSGKGPQGKTLG